MKTDIEKVILDLEKIQKVDPNPFLFTRIQARITPAFQVFSWPKVIAFSFCLTLLIALNAVTISGNLKKQNNVESSRLAETYEPLALNLYNE
jgi:hypothetical protein